MENSVYSVPAGGYISAVDARNANSYYNKFGAGGGGDPRINREMADFYREVGNDPTASTGSPALQRLQATQGVAPRLGPSFNSMLGQLLSGPYGDIAARAGFSSTYQGPWAFGKRNPDYTEYGVYRPSSYY